MSKTYEKKTIYLNQDYINKLLEFFYVKTEKEAVNLALKPFVMKVKLSKPMKK